jgi:hypothetical protein
MSLRVQINLEFNGRLMVFLSPKTTVGNKASPFPVKVYRVETTRRYRNGYDGSSKTLDDSGILTQNKEVSRQYN